MTITPTFKHLLLEDNALALVTLNRPEVRNAFNEDMLRELKEVFEYLDRSPECRVIVLRANGKSFCAGADLNWMRSMVGFTLEQNTEDSRGLARMLSTIHRCSKPVIAQVEGDVYAGGVGLVAVCDMVVASTQARFCISEARLGLIPATISPYVLRAMGEQACKRYFLTAEVFSSQKAQELGLVHECVPPEQIEDTVKHLCQAVLANAPNALGECKKLILDFSEQTISPELIEDSVQRIARTRIGTEAQERMKLFLDKAK
jgi:methylglutaconyl-CoA hydratase